MLSYLHAFHAGNFADVQKHAALSLALTMMQAKRSAIACFDTHAGSARYDLGGDRAQKTAEADWGVQKLWAAKSELLSSDWAPMLETLARWNGLEGPLKLYPGSPAWFAEFHRPGDAVTAFELHPSEERHLADWARERGVKVRHEDGLKGLLKCLPPAQPRLLTLIDPSYEIKTDYEAVAQTLLSAWKKCRHGVYLIWYPLLTSGLEQRLIDALANPGTVRKILRSEVRLNQAPERGMVGSGMLVVNPPWGFDDRFQSMMADLEGPERLGLSATLDWLVPE
ncbi:23S rRNA (adenine(2030)-N(6))-methyltransferase RlmJ [Marinobacter daepoensis]|uniref:Ribosomal RNA large subunit methyltransferase J n=1 Tax=Marinobacter daepoensis TaxID=262077 RepID=A0ABS3BIB1_9GAMM|nr:23S rRNA (adenine(2030)-N(6))-methyltransferase RlmJ [Marinobacter daepoensis]MBN7771085.1 23S rRNA (adenine(2030)-N(6))-methyltransferase RlmJ [Marinobacter daepoensis]MBY6078947.1 23S rRNA (adenine(2030)-N(6))-methyltransferase RlmJ [Marinobacter daepoensis]